MRPTSLQAFDYKKEHVLKLTLLQVIDYEVRACTRTDHVLDTADATNCSAISGTDLETSDACVAGMTAADLLKAACSYV